MSLFDISKLEQELNILEDQTTDVNFWNDSKNSKKVLSRIKQLKYKCTEYNKIKTEINDLKELSELANMESDIEVAKEIIKNTKKLENHFEKLQLQTMLSGKYDSNNEIVTIHTGAGGTESKGRAEMLYRMYSRWANKNNYEVKEI